MKCKHCKREVQDNSIFCNWCGTKLIKDVVSLPKIYRLKSGLYGAQTMFNGRRHRITAESRNELVAMLHEVKLGNYDQFVEVREPVTLKRALSSYIEANSNTLSQSTLRAYDSYSRNRLQSSMEFNIYDDLDWQAIMNDELEDVSPKTVHNIWGFVCRALERQDVEPPKVNLPKVSRKERPWLDFEQVKTFCKAVYGQPVELAALLALHSLRRSEILAITPSKIDSEFIHVRGSAVFDKDGELVFKETNKTASSQRDIPIIIPRLLDLIPDAPADRPLVTVHPNSIYDQVNKVCESAELPLVGVHGLRHSFASLGLHLGWSIETTMAYGGWSSRDVLLHVYTHQSTQDRLSDLSSMRAFYSEIYD